MCVLMTVVVQLQLQLTADQTLQSALCAASASGGAVRGEEEDCVRGGASRQRVHKHTPFPLRIGETAAAAAVQQATADHRQGGTTSFMLFPFLTTTTHTRIHPLTAMHLALLCAPFALPAPVALAQQ